MINFNEVYYKSVQKEDVAWTQSLSTMLFDLPRDGLADLKIPLSSPIFKRIWPETIRSKAFHVTDLDGVYKLTKLGKTKSISAFYNIEDIIISSGIKTNGGYVVELKGDVLVAAPDDISSQPDKTGRRWLTFSSLMNPSTYGDPGLGGGSKLKRIEKDLENLLIDILVKNDLGPYKKGLTTRELNKAWSWLGKSTGGKEKSVIIKDYIDGMEKIMKKYSKPLKSVFTDYTKKRTLDPDPDSGDTALWDELVVNNITIQKVHVGAEFGPDFSDPDVRDRFSKHFKGLGVSYKLYDDVGDIVDYITRTVQKIKL
jgi:hypothetical protein